MKPEHLASSEKVKSKIASVIPMEAKSFYLAESSKVSIEKPYLSGQYPAEQMKTLPDGYKSMV